MSKDKDTYNIAWNTFQDHLNDRSKNLYYEKMFTDVTLVSDDMIQFQAHRTVLSTASPTFMKLLMINTSANSVFYLKGVHHLELEAILQFIYLGEASVYTDRIEVFVQRSKELKINELNKDTIPEENVSVFMENQCIQSNDNESTQVDALEDEILNFHNVAEGIVNVEEEAGIQTVNPEENHDNVKIKEAQKISSESYCQICDKTFSKKSNLQAHLKSVVHYEKEQQQNQNNEPNGNTTSAIKNIQNELLCKECGKHFSTDYNLKRHIKSFHGNKNEGKIGTKGSSKTTNEEELSIMEQLQNVTANLEEEANETSINEESNRIKADANAAKGTNDLKPNNVKVSLDCKICDKKFSMERNLERHNRSIHQKIRYPCKYCGFKYTQRWSLKYHIQRVHKKVPKV